MIDIMNESVPSVTPVKPRRSLSWNHLRQYRARLIVADIIVIGVALVVAIRARTSMTVFPTATDVGNNVIPLAGVIAAAWLAIVGAIGAYRTKYLDAGMAQYRAVLAGSAITAALLGVSAYLFMYPLSRGFYFLLFLFGIPALLLERFFMRRWLHHERRRGRFRRSVVIAGDCAHIDDLNKVLQRERWLGYDVIGVLTRGQESCPIVSVPVLGEPRDVVAVAQRTKASAVIFVEGSFSRAYQFNRLARALEGQDTELIIVPALSDISSQRMTIRPVAGMPLVQTGFRHHRLRPPSHRYLPDPPHRRHRHQARGWWSGLLQAAPRRTQGRDLRVLQTAFDGRQCRRDQGHDVGRQERI